MELKFGNWEKSIEVKTPELYYNDFDGDGAKELLISVVDNYNDDIGTTDYSTTLYLVKEEESGSEKTLRYITAGEDLWKNTFKYSVKFEITQLKTEDRQLQFAMNNAGETISYDEKTGITDNKYVSYARAAAAGIGKYYTYESYSRGLGVYSVSDSGEITLDIRTFIKYSELNEPIYVGNVHCTLMVSGDSFGIKPNSISFQVLDGYKVESPVSSD